MTTKLKLPSSVHLAELVFNNCYSSEKINFHFLDYNFYFYWTATYDSTMPTLYTLLGHNHVHSRWFFVMQWLSCWNTNIRMFWDRSDDGRNIVPAWLLHPLCCTITGWWQHLLYVSQYSPFYLLTIRVQNRAPEICLHLPGWWQLSKHGIKEPVASVTGKPDRSVNTILVGLNLYHINITQFSTFIDGHF